jgi:hypothetical protein
MLALPRRFCWLYWILVLSTSVDSHGWYVMLFNIVMMGSAMWIFHFGSPHLRLLPKTFQSYSTAFSVHFGVITTTALLCVCIPLAMLPVYALRLPPGFVALSICAFNIVRGLAILWFAELFGRNYPGIASTSGPWEGKVGQGNEALDECYRRLYSKSRLTRWVEASLRVIYTGFKHNAGGG